MVVFKLTGVGEITTGFSVASVLLFYAGEVEFEDSSGTAGSVELPSAGVDG